MSIEFARLQERTRARRKAARAMLAALRKLTHPDTKPPRSTLAEWQNLPSQKAGRDAIAQAEAAGIDKLGMEQ